LTYLNPGSEQRQRTRHQNARPRNRRRDLSVGARGSAYRDEPRPRLPADLDFAEQLESEFGIAGLAGIHLPWSEQPRPSWRAEATDLPAALADWEAFSTILLLEEELDYSYSDESQEFHYDPTLGWYPYQVLYAA